jgi:hypothetical protein
MNEYGYRGDLMFRFGVGLMAGSEEP